MEEVLVKRAFTALAKQSKLALQKLPVARQATGVHKLQRTADVTHRSVPRFVAH